MFHQPAGSMTWTQTSFISYKSLLVRSCPRLKSSASITGPPRHHELTEVSTFTATLRTTVLTYLSMAQYSSLGSPFNPEPSAGQFQAPSSPHSGHQHQRNSVLHPKLSTLPRAVQTYESSRPGTHAFLENPYTHPVAMGMDIINLAW